MDASTIRLILIVVGTLLILLLFLWERHREKQEEDDERAFAIEDDEDAPYGVRAQRREPWLGEYEEGPGASTPRPAEARPSGRPPASGPGAAGDLDALEPDSDFDSLSAPPDLEPLLLQLSVSARRQPFQGPDVLDVAGSCGLHPGEMDIFHCCDELDDQIRVYFSMANMVKPGVFPFDDMDGFTTPGLVLFAQLEGDPEDMTILDEMIATARKLALALNGDVLDDSRRPLTVKKEEAMRQAVLANEMRWAKAVLR